MEKRSENVTNWSLNNVGRGQNIDADIAPDLWMFGGFGNTAVAITDAGLVIIDPSGRRSGQDILKRLRARTQAPVHTIIYTHGHLDHAGGVGAYIEDAAQRKAPRPHVIGQEQVAERFNRYKELNGLQNHMGSIQYGVSVEEGDGLDYNSKVFLPPGLVYPDTTFRDAMQFKLDGLTFELYHSKGETDDNLWVYIPERKSVIAGDAVKAGMPNIGNPFKLMLRYEKEWAETLERIAGMNPDYIIQGHGPLLKGAEAKRACLLQAAFLRWIRNEVITLMNQGCWLEEILEKIKMPKQWDDLGFDNKGLIDNEPALGQGYGCLSFVIHGIYNRYGGWYSGQPAEMFPSKRTDIAAEVVKLSGAAKLMAEAQSLLDAGNPQLALHLIDFVVNGTGDKQEKKKALLLRARILDARAAIETNGMAKNTFLRAAFASEQAANR